MPSEVHQDRRMKGEPLAADKVFVDSLASLTGFEPVTRCLEGSRSIH